MTALCIPSDVVSLALAAVGAFIWSCIIMSAYRSGER